MMPNTLCTQPAPNIKVQLAGTVQKGASGPSEITRRKQNKGKGGRYQPPLKQHMVQKFIPTLIHRMATLKW